VICVLQALERVHSTRFNFQSNENSKPYLCRASLWSYTAERQTETERDRENEEDRETDRDKGERREKKRRGEEGGEVKEKRDKIRKRAMEGRGRSD
jgi:hypothetical protein